MIVYKFLNETFGLQSLRDRRLKISRINQLNDPFEFLAVSLKSKELRRAFNVMKTTLSSKIGILCFSSYWSNPVLWSHYSDLHRGVCLGFEAGAELESIDYVARRIIPSEDWLDASDAESTVRRLLRTKFKHWEYESEVRMFVRLEKIDPETGFYFKRFSSELELREVIVGAQSDLSRREITSALGAQDSGIEITKARPCVQIVCYRSRQARSSRLNRETKRSAFRCRFVGGAGIA
jgi:hypothetical protein